MIYPDKLVDAHGAKAGLLMHAAKHLPHIPQAPMIVMGKDEPAHDFFNRVESELGTWPILFRSSAKVELFGYEGVFPTEKMDLYKEGSNWRIQVGYDYDIYSNKREAIDRLCSGIEGIATMPRALSDRDSDVPARINVIAAPYLKTLSEGTLIKHPNDPETYIATIREFGRGNTYIKTGGERFWQFNSGMRSDYYSDDMEEIASWHDQISNLPDMDTDWAYQLEFGLVPNTLFQVRPFKRNETADFSLGQERVFGRDPIVFGVTGPEGVNLKVSNPGIRREGEDMTDKAFHDDLHHVDFYGYRESKARFLVLQHGNGLLDHRDVRAIRQAEVAVIYPENYPDNFYNRTLNLVSDGKSVRMTYID